MRTNRFTRHQLLPAATALLAVLAASGGPCARAEEPAKTTKHFSFRGQRPTFHEDNIRNIEVVVTGDDSSGRQSVIESYWQPAFSVPPHFHKRHAETFYVISGQVEWTVGGDTHVLNAGDADDVIAFANARRHGASATARSTSAPTGFRHAG